MNTRIKELLRKQGYKIIGEHSAVKLCHWVRQKLFYNRPCYKEKFYGIKTHRCIQMTHTLHLCTHQCLFCWRYQGQIDTKPVWEEPKLILDECITAQRQLVSGFKGDHRCDINLWKESREPNQVAISLAGEPTLYPYLGEFISLCKDHGMTTFLVTNGTQPRMLERLSCMPTQLYVSVVAPTEEIYKKLCRPAIRNGWSLLKQTLELLPSLNTRTVIRHTLVQDWNLGFEEKYAKLDELAEPTFIEPKGYMFVGYSRKRLRLSNMPSHDKIRKFGEKLASYLNYKFAGESVDSRVVLLRKD